MNNFPKRLKEARQKAGLNQTELARAMNVTRAAVCKWEKPDTRDLSAVNLARAAKALGLSLDELMLGREHTPTLRLPLMKQALRVINQAFNHLDFEERAYIIAKTYGMLARGHQVDAKYVFDEIVTRRATESGN